MNIIAMIIGVAIGTLSGSIIGSIMGIFIISYLTEGREGVNYLINCIRRDFFGGK